MDNKRYSYSDIDNLPEGITMENAKIVAVDDGHAFQSHFAFPSSMYPCEIDHEGHKFHCAEQVFWYDIAEPRGTSECRRNCEIPKLDTKPNEKEVN